MTTAELQQHLHSLEERLLHPDREANRASLTKLLAPDFREFCASGRIFSLQQLTDSLLTSSPRSATMSRFYVTPLGPDAALATYHIATATSSTHHASIWVFRDNRWQLIFHQGTVAS
ncbi:MAG TPA: DUF4440 domain-containing protein [Edaphobacter sp.]